MSGVQTAEQKLRQLIALQTRIDNEIADLSTQLALKPSRYRSRSVRPECGGESAYQWHRHNDPDNWPLPADDPCGCRKGHADYTRLRDAVKRARERQNRRRNHLQEAS